MALNNCKGIPDTTFNIDWGDELSSKGTQVFFIEPEDGYVVSSENFYLGSDGPNNGSAAWINEFNLSYPNVIDTITLHDTSAPGTLENRVRVEIVFNETLRANENSWFHGITFDADTVVSDWNSRQLFFVDIDGTALPYVPPIPFNNLKIFQDIDDIDTLTSSQLGSTHNWSLENRGLSFQLAQDIGSISPQASVDDIYDLSDVGSSSYYASILQEFPTITDNCKEQGVHQFWVNGGVSGGDETRTIFNIGTGSGTLSNAYSGDSNNNNSVDYLSIASCEFENGARKKLGKFLINLSNLRSASGYSYSLGDKPINLTSTVSGGQDGNINFDDRMGWRFVDDYSSTQLTEIERVFSEEDFVAYKAEGFEVDITHYKVEYSQYTGGATHRINNLYSISGVAFDVYYTYDESRAEVLGNQTVYDNFQISSNPHTFTNNNYKWYDNNEVEQNTSIDHFTHDAEYLGTTISNLPYTSITNLPLIGLTTLSGIKIPSYNDFVNPESTGNQDSIAFGLKACRYKHNQASWFFTGNFSYIYEAASTRIAGTKIDSNTKSITNIEVRGSSMTAGNQIAQQGVSSDNPTVVSVFGDPGAQFEVSLTEVSQNVISSPAVTGGTGRSVSLGGSPAGLTSVQKAGGVIPDMPDGIIEIPSSGVYKFKLPEISALNEEGWREFDLDVQGVNNTYFNTSVIKPNTKIEKPGVADVKLTNKYFQYSKVSVEFDSIKASGWSYETNYANTDLTKVGKVGSRKSGLALTTIKPTKYIDFEIRVKETSTTFSLIDGVTLDGNLFTPSAPDNGDIVTFSNLKAWKGNGAGDTTNHYGTITGTAIVSKYGKASQTYTIDLTKVFKNS